MRARELACAALLAATAIGWTVDRALAAPPPSKAARPMMTPAHSFVLPAVDCTNAADGREEVTCVAMAIGAGQTAVVRDVSRPGSRKAIVVVSSDQCK